MSEAQDLPAELHALLFGVRRSTRYHVRRRQQFERFAKLIKLFTAIGGLGVVVTVLQKAGPGENWALLTFGILTGVLSVFDLVIGPDEQARTHNDLSKDFIQLEREIVLTGEALTREQLTTFIARRLEIETKEPPPLRVLDTICHNELVRAMGYGKEHQKKVTWTQQFFSPFFDWRLEATETPAKLIETKG